MPPASRGSVGTFSSARSRQERFGAVGSHAVSGPNTACTAPASDRAEAHGCEESAAAPGPYNDELDRPPLDDAREVPQGERLASRDGAAASVRNGRSPSRDISNWISLES